MKNLLLHATIALLFVGMTTATTQDTQIIELVQEEQSVLTADDLKFSTFQSCDEMSGVLEDYIKDNFKDNRHPKRRGGGIRLEDDLMVFDAVESISAPMMAKTSNIVGGSAGADTATTSSTTDFSTTNTQIQGIDEADIIKSNGEYLYYYNQKEAEVQIIKTPLDIASSTLDISRLDLITTIQLPDTFQGIQLYLQDDQLIIISNRRRNNREQSLLNNQQQVDVIVYNIANPKQPKLMRFTEIDGQYHDSRLIGDKLYIINQLWMDRYRPMQYYSNIDDLEIDVQDIQPKNIDIAYTNNDDKKNLKIEETVFPYNVSVNSSDCSDIYYVLPTADSIQQFGLHPSFTTINVIDLADTEVAPEITTTFGSTQTIHMSSDNLYLTDDIYLPGSSTFACPRGARCALPVFGGGQQHSLIHKLNIETSGVIYQDSTLIHGSPLTQYSMDQGPEGNFRILTRTWQPEMATHLSILDPDLNLIGGVQNIEPGEEFKSSRYIGDKLYLVTFERTDPLFAIDMADPTDPQILGELVIPGFSTYLHPYGELTDGVQYLLGLGRDTDLNERGGTIQEGIKLDLYKIDYNEKTIHSGRMNDTDGVSGAELGSDIEGVINYCKKFYTDSVQAKEIGDEKIEGWCERGNRNCTHSATKPVYDCLDDDGTMIGKVSFWQGKVNMHFETNEHIAITQEYSETRGERGSQSEAIHNPRMFVRDEARDTLVLPMHLMSEEKGNEVCEIERDPEGNIIREECRNNGRSQTDFVGMKAIKVTPETGITETHSFDYKTLLAQDSELYNNGRYNTRSLMPRVGYVGDMLYQINGAFGHFVHLDGAASSESYLGLGDNEITFPDVQQVVVGGSTSGNAFVANEMNVTKCLANQGWTLYTADDCRYCEPQADEFGKYYAKLAETSVINCDAGEQEQAMCSDAGITAYPTRIDNQDTTHTGYHDLTSLAAMANCT